MGKTVRSWQKRSGWQVNRHKAAKRRRLAEPGDKFRFDPRAADYRGNG